MRVFRLYRIQLFQKQLALFPRSWTPPEVLDSAMDEPLYLRLRTRAYYTEGMAKVPPYVFFRFARTGNVKANAFVDGRPISVDYPDQPFVDVVINIATGVCAISRNYKFLSNQDASASRLAEVIQRTPSVLGVGAEVKIDPLRDPESLISQIRKAAAIYSMYFDVRRENAFDADDFVPGIKRLAGRSGAERARTHLLEGPLDKEVVEGLVRSSASTGDDAGVWLRLPWRSSVQKKTLGRSNVEFSSEEDNVSAEELGAHMDFIYRKSRKGDD